MASSAIVLNISDISKIVTVSDLQNPDRNIDNNFHFLIICNGDTIKSSGSFSAYIALSKLAGNVCFLEFKIIGNTCLHANVKLLQNESNLHEVTLYYVNSEITPQFLGTLDVSNCRPLTIHSFGEELQFFTNGYLNDNKFINRHICIYCKIKTKDHLPIKFPIHKKEMPAQFVSLYDDKLLTDFKIICEDKKYLVHKVVLAYRSPVFRAMFESKMIEAQENKMEINDFKPEIVEHMVRYIYTDEINVELTEEELKMLLMIANKYELGNLKILCLQEISKSVKNISEVFEFCNIAKENNVTEFNETLIQFIKDNRHIVLK